MDDSYDVPVRVSIFTDVVEDNKFWESPTGKYVIMPCALWEQFNDGLIQLHSDYMKLWKRTACPRCNKVLDRALKEKGQ